MTRFRSNRSEHNRLKTSMKGKSGDGAKILTPKQRFKLERWSFLDQYKKPKIKTCSLGKVCI